MRYPTRLRDAREAAYAFAYVFNIIETKWTETDGEVICLGAVIDGCNDLSTCKRNRLASAMCYGALGVAFGKEGESVMDLLVEHVDVWAATIQDRPGSLAELLTNLREAGADLQLIIARRAPEKPGTGVVFVTPLQGDQEIRAASELGFNVTQSLHSIRIMGQDRPGIAARLTRKLAEGGINLRGFVASVIGSQFVAYVGVDSLADTKKAMQILARA